MPCPSSPPGRTGTDSSSPDICGRKGWMAMAIQPFLPFMILLPLKHSLSGTSGIDDREECHRRSVISCDLAAAERRGSVGRKTRRERGATQIAIVVAAVVICVIAIKYHDYSTAVSSGCFAVAATCWFIAVKFPTKCRVMTTKGTPCRNTASGVLFGCSGAAHTWDKFHARFRRPKVVAVQPSQRAVRSEEPAEPKRPTIAPSAGDKEAKRSTVLFWLAVVATSAGTISMTTDVLGLFS
jgi:hypothetical protein